MQGIDGLGFKSIWQVLAKRYVTIRPLELTHIRPWFSWTLTLGNLVVNVWDCVSCSVHAQKLCGIIRVVKADGCQNNGKLLRLDVDKLPTLSPPSDRYGPVVLPCGRNGHLQDLPRTSRASPNCFQWRPSSSLGQQVQSTIFVRIGSVTVQSIHKFNTAQSSAEKLEKTIPRAHLTIDLDNVFDISSPKS